MFHPYSGMNPSEKSLNLPRILATAAALWLLRKSNGESGSKGRPGGDCAPDGERVSSPPTVSAIACPLTAASRGPTLGLDGAPEPRGLFPARPPLVLATPRDCRRVVEPRAALVRYRSKDAACRL